MVITEMEYNAVCPVCDSHNAYESEDENGRKLECQRCGFIEIINKDGKRRIINLGRKITKRFKVNVSFITEVENEDELIKYINEHIRIKDKEVSYKEEK